MKTKKIAIVMMSFLMLSGVLIATVSADSWPVLPSSPVTLVTYNDEWDFPFDVWRRWISSAIVFKPRSTRQPL